MCVFSLSLSLSQGRDKRHHPQANGTSPKDTHRRREKRQHFAKEKRTQRLLECAVFPQYFDWWCFSPLTLVPNWAGIGGEPPALSCVDRSALHCRCHPHPFDTHFGAAVGSRCEVFSILVCWKFLCRRWEISVVEMFWIEWKRCVAPTTPL